MLTLFALALLAAIGVDGIRPGPWPPNTYTCERAASTVTVDGNLNDDAWSAVPWTDTFGDIEGDRRPRPRFDTRTKMLWDDDYFYIAARLEEPHLWATLRERDSVIFHDNDFEVFLDPDGDSHLYTEIELNAFNTVWDLLLVKPYRDGGPAIHAWDIPGLKTAVQLDGTVNDPSDLDVGWSVEIAIPFAVIAETTTSACPPGIGDRWRVNFSRVQWQLETTTGEYRKVLAPETGKPMAEDNWTWSPQREIAMHEPEHWGIVVFVAQATESRIEPTGVDMAAWYLRQASYHLAAYRTEHGRYPEVLTMPVPGAGGPKRDAGWRWPPDYWSDGTRYTLTIDLADERLQLDENGRLHTLAKD